MPRRETSRSRRRFLAAAAALGAHAACRAARLRDADESSAPFFTTRGVVLVPDDLSLADWPQRAHAAGLTTIALHHGASPSVVSGFLGTERGRRFLLDCRRLGLAVEYELHAMAELLPRELFAADPQLFRMNDGGERTPDANLCVHSRAALELVAENALRLDARLTPATHRRFLWGDDGAPWCRCPQCAALSDSEQALIVENAIAAALARVDPEATLAHLAYAGTLEPPRQIAPARNVFLEFAPLAMRLERPLTPLAAPQNADVLALLDANLAIFPSSTAQALEYWLDVSMYSGWRRPARPLPWSDELFAADLATYASRGVRHVTSFAVWIDAEYVAGHGFPEAVDRYGAELSRMRR